MTLAELAAAHPRWPAAAVPPWALGCFRRQSIVYAHGPVDTATEVWWLQSGALTADLRLRRAPGGGPLTAPADRLLAEGGLAETRWDGARMSWHGWVSLQTHDRWPEPGELRRVGESLIEFAPSGAYVEDWRWQPPGDGPLAGLRLIEERDAATGEPLARGGGLVVAGRHAALVRGRPRAFPTGRPLPELIAAHPERLTTALTFEASYATADDAGRYHVRLSTIPEREGTPFTGDGLLTGFSLDPATGYVRQLTVHDGRDVLRLFTIDTLAPQAPRSATTAVSTDGAAWLAREAPAT